MRWRSNALWVLCFMATTLNGCQQFDRGRLYARCEIPLNNFVCPVVDLSTIVPEEAQNNDDQPRWGCELWLVDHMSDADGQMVLATDGAWSIETRQREGEDVDAGDADAGDAGVEGSVDWPCGDDVNQRIILDPAIAATYRGGYLVCLSDQERVGECPDLERSTPRRTCSKRGDPAEIGQGVAISSVVMTDDGPAVVWHQGSYLERMPAVTWLDVTVDGVALPTTPEMPVWPCEGEPCDGRGPEACPLPRQSASSGGAVLSPGLCGASTFVKVSKNGREGGDGFDSIVLDTAVPEARALAVTTDDQGDYLLLWSNGPRLMATPFEEESGRFNPTGGDLGLHHEIWNPDKDDRGVPSAACFDTATDRPRCMVSWVTPESLSIFDEEDSEWILTGIGGDIQWQLVDPDAELEDAGVLGPGQHVQLAMSTSGDDSDGGPLGIAVWREAHYGVLASAWRAGLERSVEGPEFGSRIYQLGEGQVDESGAWTVSIPTVFPIDRYNFIVGWWRLRDGLDEAELVTRMVRVERDSLILSVVHLDLGDPLVKRLVSADGAAAPFEPFPPVMAWGRGPEDSQAQDGALLVVWNGPWDTAVSIRTFFPSEWPPPPPPAAVVFDRGPDNFGFDSSEFGAAMGGDAVAAEEGFVAAVTFAKETGAGLVTYVVVLLLDWRGEEVDRKILPQSPGVVPFDVTLWSGEQTDIGGIGVWLIYNYTFEPPIDETAVEYPFLVGCGGATFLLDWEGLHEHLHEQWLLPEQRRERSWPMYPTFADSVDPMLIWAELDLSAVPELFETTDDVDPLLIQELLEDAEMRFSIRLARVNADLDLHMIDVPVPHLSMQEPRYAFAAPNGCGWSTDDGSCTAVSFTSLVPSDLPWLGDGTDSPQDIPGSGFALGYLEAGEATVSMYGEDFFGHSWPIPTGVVQIDSAILSVFSELDPWNPSPGTVQARRLSVGGDETANEPETLGADWLGAVGSEDLQSWRPVSMRLHSADSQGSAGAVWSRHSDDFDEESSTTAASLDNWDRGGEELQIIFAEVDSWLWPTSRALEIDRHPIAPRITFSTPDRLYVSIDAAHFNSAVVETGSGEYVVVWVRHHMEETDLSSTDLTGDVMAQLIVCE